MCKNLTLIALAIDENFSEFFTLTEYEFRTNVGFFFGSALTFLASALWDGGFLPFSCVNFFH
jgi:hypothetical protein